MTQALLGDIQRNIKYLIICMYKTYGLEMCEIVTGIHSLFILKPIGNGRLHL